MATDKFITKEQLAEILQDRGFKNEASTSEEEWGTWIDGKTIYKKSFNATYSTYVVDGNFRRFTGPEITADKIINIEGSYKMSGLNEYQIWQPGLSAQYMTAGSYFYMRRGNNDANYIIWIFTPTSVPSVTLKLTVYYTKA